MMRHYLLMAALKADDVGIPKPGGGSDAEIIKNILFPVYFWAGAIAVIVLIIAGFLYVLSNGDPQKITRAKNAIIGAVAGLVIVILAFAITSIVLGAL